MKRLAFWLPVIAGAAAAYLMYRRGESLPKIAQKTIFNPIGSFTSEVKQAL